MKLNKLTTVVAALCAAATIALFAACNPNNPDDMHRPTKPELPGDLPDVGNIHTYKAPLYWSVYEYCYGEEVKGNKNIDFTAEHWDEIIEWVARELKPYGYDMVCTDGFCAMLSTDATGYMTQYGSVKLKDLVAKCKAKGLKLGVYDNPLWLHGNDNTKIQGTDYTFGSLKYNNTDKVLHPNTKDQWFSWVVATHPGAREYIDGFFKHYKELGVEYIRMDFMSWYEDGQDRNMHETVGRGYGSDTYARAMAYIAESAKKYGIFTSVVMPHLNNDAAVETKYGNMVRIVADTGNGGWWHCSVQDRGKAYSNWPNCMNQFDGFTYWSHIAGRNKVILDGDFIILNRFDTPAEKEFVISLQLMAGGPVTPSDQPNTIREGDLQYYTNREMLALNADGFVGKPMNDQLNSAGSQIWYGKMTDGSWVLGIFNRNDKAEVKTVNFADFGATGEYKVRDLWRHSDEGTASSITANIPAHGCKIVKLSK